MPEKLFVFDESELTPKDFDRFPVWMNAHWFDDNEVERKYGPFTERPTEAARIAYQGPLPYPLSDEDDEHPSHVFVRCVVTIRGGDEFQGYLTPLLAGEDLVRLYPQVFARETTWLCHGELSAAEQATLFPRWRAQVEAAFGRPLSELFPVTLMVPDGILPPAVPSRWTLPGLMYLANWRPQVVPVT